MVFAARVLLVEGFAELVLAPRFAAALDIDLDRLGITVCAIHGTHFGSYARFLAALEIPWAALTDGDPDAPQTGQARADALLDRLGCAGEAPEDVGIFVGATTLERDIYDRNANNRVRCLKALRSERIPQRDLQTVEDALRREQAALLRYRAARRRAEGERVAPPAPILNSENFLAIVKKAGKGSFAQRLAGSTSPPRPPAHFQRAIERLTQ
jgi:predicted ATP-dependent endonuclease of OLD family